jgi:hypothetical protein
MTRFLLEKSKSIKNNVVTWKLLFFNDNTGAFEEITREIKPKIYEQDEHTNIHTGKVPE